MPLTDWPVTPATEILCSPENESWISVADFTACKTSKQRRFQMDPNEILKEIRATVWALNGLGDSDRGRQRIDLETRLTNGFHALDQWMSNGGFLPDAWDHSDPDSVAK